jgi:superfamily II DNA or RNA helicase
MSIKVLRSLLLDSHVDLIRKMLIIYPLEKEVFTKRGEKKNFNPVDTKEPIQFYYVQDGYVYLPFQFGNILMGKIYNFNNFYPIHNFSFIGQLRDYQIEDMNTAFKQLTTYCSTTLNFSTGAGKTICSAFLSCSLKLLTLVLIHLTPLMESWKETFKNNTNAKIWLVGEMDMPKEFDVIICMEQRVEKIEDDILKKVGFLVIDEADRFTTKSRVKPLLAVQPKYIVGLTATLDLRVDGMDVMLHSLLGTHKVVRNIQKKITLYRVNTDFAPVIQKTSRGTDWSVVSRSLSENDERNNEIVDFVYRHNTHKILILCHLVEHVKALYGKFIKRNNEFKCVEQIVKVGLGRLLNRNLIGLVEKYLGDDRLSVDSYSGNKKKFNDSQVLIGSTRKIGIGFDDQSGLENDGIRINMLIITSSMKDLSLLTQVLGRIRDNNPIIVYLVDANATIQSHFRVAKKFVEEKSGVVIKWEGLNGLNVGMGKYVRKVEKEVDVVRNGGNIVNGIVKPKINVKLNIL